MTEVIVLVRRRKKLPINTDISQSVPKNEDGCMKDITLDNNILAIT